MSVCSACPRLVAWREQVADQKRASFADQPYWGRPIAGWGDEHPSVLIVGLAPAANGGNRTGRVFTGDSSGDWLFASLHRVGLAAQSTSRHAVRAAAARRPDGRDGAVRAAAQQADDARAGHLQAWIRQEIALVADSLRVVVALGGFGWTGALDALAAAGYVVPKPRRKFGHGASVAPPDPTVDRSPCSAATTPSQQNTFTGRLTEAASRRRPRPRRVVPPVTSYDLVARATTSYDVRPGPPYPNR